MFALDTNILVYAHNLDSPFKDKSKDFLERVLNDRDDEGNLSICIPTQVLIEFINVITRQNMESPLLLDEAIKIVNDYLASGIKIVHPQETQLSTFLELLKSVTTRKKVFDVALVATLKDNEISGLYTANINDFKDFDFLKVENPIK